MTSSLSLDTPQAASPPRPAQVRDLNWSRAVWLLLIVVCGALFLDGLDLSMIGVALPSIGRSLHLQAASLQWIVSGYVLGYGSLLLLGGRTSDLVSRRSVFLVAVTVFAVASVTGYALFLRATPTMPYVEFMLPTMLLIGIGFGLCFAALNAQATSGVADHEQGLASGLLNTSLQIGGAVVLAVVTAILGNTTSVTHDQLLPHAHTAIEVVIGVSVAAVALTVAHLYRTREAVFTRAVAA
jgi:MFS family permease